MAYDFQERLDRLGVKHKARNRKSIVYSRGVTTLAVIGSPMILRADEVSPGVSVQRVEFHAWTFDHADLVATFGFPQPADKITAPDGDVYRVVSLGNDTPCYEFTTSSQKRIRVHTLRESVG